MTIMKRMRKLIENRINGDCPARPDIEALRRQYEALVEKENQEGATWKTQETAGQSGESTS